MMGNYMKMKSGVLPICIILEEIAINTDKLNIESLKRNDKMTIGVSKVC